MECAVAIRHTHDLYVGRKRERVGRISFQLITIPEGEVWDFSLVEELHELLECRYLVEGGFRR